MAEGLRNRIPEAVEEVPEMHKLGHVRAGAWRLRLPGLRGSVPRPRTYRSTSCGAAEAIRAPREEEMKFATEVEKSLQWSLSTLKNKAARDWQKCIRAEYGAKDRAEFCIVNGDLGKVYSPLGSCVCVTCGKVGPWKGQVMDAGHFIGGRSNSILFEPFNIHPQCKYCNRSGSEPQAYQLFMESVYSEEIVAVLKQMKRESMSFTREELVTMRRSYRERVRAAERVMG